MGIIDYASPEARYYEADRAIMDDYDNRINIYNAALEKYKSQAGDYQAKVDAHNKIIEDYNAKLQDWRNKAEAYNAAIAKWNETDRTVAYDPNWSGYVASPGEWFGTAPVFEGGAAPAAPSDPGFTEDDVNAFIDKAQGRAQRRGQASATAQQVISTPSQYYVTGHENFGSNPEISLAGMSGFGSDAMGFDAGGIVPPPVPTEEDLARAAAVEDTGRGIGYYIPPELQEKGRQFTNLASALDPAQGIMRGMAASGRVFDESLTPEQRREAGIEAALETAAPLGIGVVGKLAKQPIRAILMDMLTPTGATKEVLQETAEDLLLGAPASMGRRKFLKGAAATAGVAAIAPDLAMEAGEAVTKATKAAAKVRINPLDMAMQNIRELRRQIDEGYAIVNEVLDNPRSSGMRPDERAAMDEANKAIQTAELEIIDEAYDAIMMMDKSDFAEAITDASDEALEAIIEPQYESIMGNQRLVDDGENSVRLAQEAHRRGLHLAKDKNGIDKFPNARAFVEDFFDAAETPLDNSLGGDIPVGSNMTRSTPSDLTQEIDAMRIRSMYRTMEDEILKMRDMGRTEAEIEAYRTSEQARINEAQGLPSDMDDFYADGGVVTLKDTAVNMFRGPQGIGAYQQYAEGGPVISEDALTQMRQKVINDYGFDPIDIAMQEGVDPDLFLRVMWTENRGRQGPVSDAGAIGLMQLMPDTAAELGVDPNNPLDNARGGARYLRQQLNTFQSIPLALAAYNAGPNAVRKYNGVPPYEETRNYVAMIHGVDAGEILPSMSDFYTRVPGEDPSRKPRMRPEGLGTPGYVPAEPAQSEYLMGIGQTFMNTIQPERTPAPYIPNIMQPQEQPQEDARGIEFYRQYAAFQPPTAAG